jgi:hypothetical protein
MKLREISITAQDMIVTEDKILYPPQTISYDLSPSIDDEFGRVITKSFAENVVGAFEDFRDKSEIKEIIDVRRVNISKELINLILSQEKCEGFSIFFCLSPSQEEVNSGVGRLHPERKLSTLLMGMDKDGNPLTKLNTKRKTIKTEESITVQDDDDNSIIVELGGHSNPFIKLQNK